MAGQVEIKNLDEVKKKVKSLQGTWDMWSTGASPPPATRSLNPQRAQLAQMGKDATSYWELFLEDPTRHPSGPRAPPPPSTPSLPVHYQSGSGPIITPEQRRILDALDNIQHFDAGDSGDLHEGAVRILDIVRDIEAPGTHLQHRSNQQIYLTIGSDRPSSREEVDPLTDVSVGMVALVLMRDGGRIWDIGRVERVWSDVDGTPKMDLTYLHPNKKRPFDPSAYPWPSDWHKSNLVEWRGPNGAPWTQRGMDREAVMWCDTLERKGRHVAGKLTRMQAKVLSSAIANMEQQLVNGTPVRPHRMLNHNTMPDDDGGGYSDGDGECSE